MDVQTPGPDPRCTESEALGAQPPVFNSSPVKESKLKRVRGESHALSSLRNAGQQTCLTGTRVQ